MSAQIRYTGMLDTIRIRKAGFLVRVPYDQFLKKFAIIYLNYPTSFKCLIPTGISINPDLQNVAKTIMELSRLSTDIWQCGKTHIFMKNEAVR